MCNLLQQLLSKLNEQILYHLISITSIALAWVLLFKFNTLLFSYFEISHLINWIFLPAGLKLMAVLLFNIDALIGIFIGSLATALELNMHSRNVVFVSMISAVSPYVAFLFTRCCLKIKLSLHGLTTQQLLMMCLIYALLNALLHNLYFFHTGMTQKFFSSTLNMFIGDLLGAILMFYAFSLSIKLIRKLA